MAITNFINESSPGSGSEDISDIVELVGDVRGASGQDVGSGSGGNGASLDVTIDVSGFDDLYWHVGGQDGTNGGGDFPLISDDYDGGGGGGASDIRVSADITDARVVVAGGGGGAGDVDGGSSYNGGDAGQLNGEDGDENPDFSGSAGAGGITEDQGGGPEDDFEGQDADEGEANGGAGGGGYWAGASGDYGSGGGGGASHVDGIVKSYSTAAWSGDDGDISLDAREAATANPEVQETDPYFTGQTITLDANISEGYYSVSSVEWDLGDGTTKNGEIVDHAYSTSGTYTAEVTIIDSEGYETVESLDITIEDPVTPSFTYDTPVTQGFDVTFTDESTVNPDATIDDEFWRVDGSRVSSSTDLTYNFDAPGEFIVEKVFEAYGNEYTDQDTVDVEPAATVDFSYSSPVVSGIEHTFTDETTVVDGATRESEEWVIDGSLVGTNKDLNYTFSSEGTYSVGKIVTVNGYDYSTGESVTVEQNTTADFSFSPDDPLVDEEVSFTDESVTPFNITSYSWDLGDGTTSTDQDPVNTYTERGEYSVTLTVEDDEDQTDSTTQIVEVFSRKPTVETDPATDIGDFEATLNGVVVDVGVDSSADVYFEYREAGDSTWSSTPVQSVSDTGEYSETLTDLNIETDYEYRAVGENSEGVLTASTETFSTNDNTPPEITVFNVSPDPIERFTLHDVTVEASDQVGIVDVTVEWFYDGTLETSSSQTYSSASSISEVFSDFYEVTEFGDHSITVTVEDELGSTNSTTLEKFLGADTPDIVLDAPGDGATFGYSETFDYIFTVETGNAEVTSGELIVQDENDNTVQTESVGVVDAETSQQFDFASTQVESPGEYTWIVELDYEDDNFIPSDSRVVTVSEPSDVSVETGQVGSIGFNFFDAEGGLIFAGESSTIDLYFRYRKQGESEWNETDREVYDNV